MLIPRSIFWLQDEIAVDDMLCDSHFYKPKHVEVRPFFFFFLSGLFMQNNAHVYFSVFGYKVWKQIHGGHVRVNGQGRAPNSVWRPHSFLFVLWTFFLPTNSLAYLQKSKWDCLQECAILDCSFIKFILICQFGENINILN